jgi:diguanylate cyclase (GGDEF)-like protein
VSAYGPLIPFSLRVHQLSHVGRSHEALDAADAYIRFARAAGDEKTVSFLIQGKMYAYLSLGGYEEALRLGEELLRRHEAAGFTLGEAKTRADLAELNVLTGRSVEGMRHLARAGLLLDTSPRRDDRYLSALGSIAEAANSAELHEVAAARYEELLALMAPDRRHVSTPYEMAYATTLMFWGIRLDHLGHDREAAVRLRRSVTIADLWLDASSDDRTSMAMAIRSIQALALAKLGEVDRAGSMAADLVVPLRQQEQHWAARLAHLAFGVSLRGRGDLAAARREFIAAEQLCALGARSVERLLIRYEIALLAAEVCGGEAGRDLMDTVREQARTMWQLRLERLAMLRQAQQREQLESDRARAEAELMRDPLTGLGNRRRFDQLVAAIDAGTLPGPTVMLLIDVDRFKAINDVYSHSAGDRVLGEIGRILRAHCRAEDVPVRFAGDEFTVFLRADLAAGRDAAERIRSAVATADFSAIAPGTAVTVSAGVAALRAGMTGADLFQEADRRLYQAKRNGRDRVAA